MEVKIMFDVKLKILNKIVSDGNNFFCSGGNQCDREKFLFIEFAMNGKSFVFIIKGGEVIDYFCRE